jgi:hypothetical protein
VFFRGIVAALTFAVAIAVAWSSAARADEMQNVEEYYRGVLARMSKLPQPQLVSYDVVARASGATFYVSRDPQNGEAEFGFSVGPALGDTSQWWPVLVRTTDNTTSVLLDGTARAVTHFPALNATWGGIDAWMRFGMAPSTPAPLPSPGASSNTTSADYPVIAVVRSLDLGIYRVRDGGATRCADKSPARLLHLTAREDPSRHPATDVTVQTSTQTVCAIRFELERSDLVDRNGHVELYISQVGPYYLVDRGEISFDAGPRFGRQHVRLFLDYVRTEFPPASPAGAFSTPSPNGLP